MGGYLQTASGLSRYRAPTMRALQHQNVPGVFVFDPHLLAILLNAGVFLSEHAIDSIAIAEKD